MTTFDARLQRHAQGLIVTLEAWLSSRRNLRPPGKRKFRSGMTNGVVHIDARISNQA